MAGRSPEGGIVRVRLSSRAPGFCLTSWIARAPTGFIFQRVSWQRIEKSQKTQGVRSLDCEIVRSRTQGGAESEAPARGTELTSGEKIHRDMLVAPPPSQWFSEGHTSCKGTSGSPWEIGRVRPGGLKAGVMLENIWDFECEQISMGTACSKPAWQERSGTPPKALPCWVQRKPQKTLLYR